MYWMRAPKTSAAPWPGPPHRSRGGACRRSARMRRLSAGERGVRMGLAKRFGGVIVAAAACAAALPALAGAQVPAPVLPAPPALPPGVTPRA